MIDYNKNLDEACAKFRKILESQLARVKNMKAQGDFTDYAALETIKIGVCGGDGIGPIISKEAERVLKFMLADLVESGKVTFTDIEGLTIENRIAKGKAIPDDVMAELKACATSRWLTVTVTSVQLTVTPLLLTVIQSQE